MTPWARAPLRAALRELARGVAGRARPRVPSSWGPGWPDPSPGPCTGPRESSSPCPAVSVDLRLFEPWPGSGKPRSSSRPRSGLPDLLAWATFEPDGFAARWLPAQPWRRVPRRASISPTPRARAPSARATPRAPPGPGPRPDRFLRPRRGAAAVLGLRHAKAALRLRIRLPWKTEATVRLVLRGARVPRVRKASLDVALEGGRVVAVGRRRAPPQRRAQSRPGRASVAPGSSTPTTCSTPAPCPRLA